MSFLIIEKLENNNIHIEHEYKPLHSSPTRIKLIKILSPG